MSIETTSCVMCGYTLLLIDNETQTCINCNTEREFKRVIQCPERERELADDGKRRHCGWEDIDE